MSVRGGYQIIDLQHTNFTSGTPTAVSGIYETIEASHKKFSVENFVVDGVEYKPMYANFVNSGGTFEADPTAKINIKVAENDEVTVTISE